MSDMILIDIPIWAAHGTVFAHLVSDTSFEELHEFAARVGMPRGPSTGTTTTFPSAGMPRAWLPGPLASRASSLSGGSMLVAFGCVNVRARRVFTVGSGLRSVRE